MTVPLTIVGLGGSLNARSASLAALETSLEVVAEQGVSTHRFAVCELDLPFYDPAIDPPESAREFAAAVGGADALIWSALMCHGTVSGSFKNAVDWLQLLADHEPPFLANKPVGLISAAGGLQGLQAINTMDFAVRALRGWVVPFVVPIAQGWGAFDPSGRPTGEVRAQLEMLAHEVVGAARQLRATHGDTVLSKSA